jgi:hypothetical protein
MRLCRKPRLRHGTWDWRGSCLVPARTTWSSTPRVEYESHFNGHRPHRALHQACPLRALPGPIDADIEVTRRYRLGGLLHEYSQVA